MKAQIARGADFESGNMLQRAKAMIPILVPLVCICVPPMQMTLPWRWRQDATSGGDGRTKMKPLRYVSSDRVAYAIVIALCGSSMS